MEPEKLILEKEGRDAMAILARLRDPDAALLYAFAASRPQGCTQAEAAAALDWDEGRTDRAAQLLLVYGLAARRHLPPPRQETAFLPQELSAAREGDPAFAGLCSYFERAQGRILNRRELETLLSVHESLGLPPEVMALVIGECARRGRLSARSVEKLAYQWYDLGLDQYEKAEEYLRRQALREDRYARVLTRFGIRDHAPSPGERDYLDRWFALGFSDEMLALAYDRTILGAHRFSWAYMNKILLDWSEKKLRTPEDVQNARRAPVSRPGAVPAAPQESAESVILRRMQEKRQSRALELERRREALRRASPEFVQTERAIRLLASRMARSQGEARAALEPEYRAALARQSTILSQQGKPADWLTDKPDCPLCGDRGYIGSQKCRCLAAAIRAAEKSPAGV